MASLHLPLLLKISHLALCRFLQPLLFNPFQVLSLSLSFHFFQFLEPPLLFPFLSPEAAHAKYALLAKSQWKTKGVNERCVVRSTKLAHTKKRIEIWWRKKYFDALEGEEREKKNTRDRDRKRDKTDWEEERKKEGNSREMKESKYAKDETFKWDASMQSKLGSRLAQRHFFATGLLFFSYSSFSLSPVLLSFITYNPSLSHSPIL